MKKIIYLILALICLLMFNSCRGDVDMENFGGDRDNNLADNRMKQVFDAVKNKDQDALSVLFSEVVSKETEKLNESIDDLFTYIQGNCISWDRDESSVVFDSNQNGKRTKQLLTWFSLNTDEQKYFVYIVDYPTNTIDPDNEGMYTLMILKVEDENKLSGTMEDWIKPGIYIPYK